MRSGYLIMGRLRYDRVKVLKQHIKMKHDRTDVILLNQSAQQ